MKLQIIGPENFIVNKLARPEKFSFVPGKEPPRFRPRADGKEENLRGYIEISPKIVDVKDWNEKVEIYALSRLAIGISPERNSYWEKISLYHEEVSIDKTDHMLSLKLPDQLISFYEIQNSEVEVTGMDDKALLTIQSTVVPVDLPFDRRKDTAYVAKN